MRHPTKLLTPPRGPRMSVPIVDMRDGVDQSVDTLRQPITSAWKPSLVRVSECTTSSEEAADGHGTNSHISGTNP
jgi:hypothetical protein